MTCILCHSPSVELHHVFFGGHKRNLSDKYGLLVPVCRTCHNRAHGKHKNHKAKHLTQEQYEEIFCNKLGVDYELTNLAINTANHEALKVIKNHILSNKKALGIV